MDPQLQQGLFHLVYFTYLHNAEAIAWAIGIVLIIFLLLIKPRRYLILFLIGFVSLLIRFEYLKHFVDPLLEQTQVAVLPAEGHAKADRALTLFFDRALPLALYIVGWGGVFVAILFSGGKKVVKQKKEKNGE